MNGLAMRMRYGLMAVTMAVASVGVSGRQETPATLPTVFDEDVDILAYTPIAHPGPVESSGTDVVVVRVELNRRGRPTSAQALSGPAHLRTTAAENAKLLLFAPNPVNAAVVVYEFATADACFGKNYWVVANLITVTGCRRQYPWP
jgi:hypothetical protein